MNEEVKIVDKEVLEKIVATLKESASMFLVDLYHLILMSSLEERTPEHNIMLLEEAEAIKKEVFEGVLESYNDFIKDKNLIDYYLSKQHKEQKIMIESMNYDMVKTGMIALGVTIILPALRPITFIVTVPKIGLDAYQKALAEEIVKIIEIIKEDYDSIQNDFYPFVDSLRSDYYRSKNEIKKLKKQAKEGKEIIDELIKIVNPETLNLPLAEFNFLPETEEKPKQFVK